MRASLARSPVRGHAAAGADPGRRKLRAALAYGCLVREQHVRDRRALARVARCRYPAATGGAAAPLLAQQRLAHRQPMVRSRDAASVAAGGAQAPVGWRQTLLV